MRTMKYLNQTVEDAQQNADVRNLAVVLIETQQSDPNNQSSRQARFLVEWLDAALTGRVYA